MLLQRLVEYTHTHFGEIRPFHREREFRWQLDIDFDGRLLNTELTPIEGESHRGRVHRVPAVVRTVGVAPNLAADDVQYVLGWGDESTKPARVAQCHTAFMDLIKAWAESEAGQKDWFAQAVAKFYRSGEIERLQKQADVSPKHGVLLVVEGKPAYAAPSIIEFWTSEVGLRKGGKTGTRQGLCLVCGQVNPLLDTLPGKVPGRLVPGASNDAALVSVNERVFGYGLSTGLEHTPICFPCGDAISTGLVGALSSEHSTAPPGQNSRLAWWITGDSTEDPVALLDEADPEDILALLQTVHRGQPDENPPDVEVFCALTVGGNVARIMVRDWIEMPLIEIKKNIGAWFLDHEIGSSFPDGRRWHRLWQMVLAAGRWQRDRKRYADLSSRGADRPHNIHRDLLRAALRGDPIPVAVLVHLVHRVRADGHFDDARAALIRLALTRSTLTEEKPMPDLDPKETDPAYVAGRAFAVLEQIQRAAGSGERVNATYGDRFFAGAISNPRAALVSGRRDANAWLRKIRRGKPGLAGYFDKKLDEVFGLLEPPTGIPGTITLAQQAKFLLGYHHQRAHRDTPAASTNGTASTASTAGEAAAATASA